MIPWQFRFASKATRFFSLVTAFPNLKNILIFAPGKCCEGTKSPFLLEIKVDTEVVKLKIEEWLEEKFSQQPEFFLVDVKVQGRKIVVFLDGDNGISIDKCAEFSRYLESHLEGEMLVDANYILDVSSPGLENPLRVKRQYRNAVGKEVSVVKFDGNRLDGVLKNEDENKLVLEITVKEKGMTEATKTEEILLTDIKSTKLKINI